MRLGTAWLVLEESFHSKERRLLSIISSKKGNEYLRDYIEQRYVDTFASFQEKVAYKKNRETSSFRIEKYAQMSTTISCGDEPVYRAYRCHKLRINGGSIEFSYWVFVESQGSIEKKVYREEVLIS